MVRVRYDESLLARLPLPALRGPVAALCRGDTPAAVASARLVESWVDRFDAPAKCRRDVTSADRTSFWSGWWELASAASLSAVGFSVDLRFRLPDGRTPDLVVARDGLRMMVEVFVVGDDDRTRRERALLADTAERLQRRIELPPATFVSMSALGPVHEAPTEGALDRLAEALTPWLLAPDEEPFEYLGDLPVHATAMHGDPEPYLAFTPAGGALNQTARIRDRLKAKIERYAGSATPDLRLTVAVCEGSWKITQTQMLTALYGAERLHLDPVSGDVVGASYDGSGAAVLGGPNAADGAEAFSGAWYLSSGLYDVDPPAVHVTASFAHSPYCSDPLPPGSLLPFPELQVHGDALRWTGERRDLVVR